MRTRQFRLAGTLSTSFHRETRLATDTAEPGFRGRQQQPVLWRDVFGARAMVAWCLVPGVARRAADDRKIHRRLRASAVHRSLRVNDPSFDRRFLSIEFDDWPDKFNEILDYCGLFFWNIFGYVVGGLHVEYQ
ncbi:hypothetical protein [Burkholderia sp. SIMBA_062]|uniref:hypothetical protein n=1 Tax=Burkholderia sp. SIMBA_062 TaxID=3085803 RepID=UPI00397E5181